MKDLIERFEASYDSSWLPEEMLEIYSPVECLADNPQCTTLLLRSRTDADMSVAKCYSKDSVMVSVTEDDILSSISHDGLPDYVGRYENDRTVCVVRKYIEGKTFDSVIRGKKFTPEETASFALKICDILEYLHSRPQPVLHRDIKPGNIVVDTEDNVYLIDFGISRLLRDTEKKDTKIAVTASYAPPEQFGFLPTDARSDIYALGVVLNEMLTGSTQLSGGASGGMGRIVSKCTAFSPDDRYRSARQLKKEISRWRYRHLRRAAAVLAAAVAIPLTVFLCGLLARSKPQPAVPPMQEISAYSFEPETGILTLSDGAELSEELKGITDDTSLYKVTELVLGEGVSGVDRESCGGFTGLKRLTISASVYESMNGDEFNGADRLDRITVLPDEGSGVGWTYDRTNRTLELFCSGSGTGVVKGENFWHKLECIDKTWIRYVSVGEGVTGLGFNMLWDHQSLESVELPRSLVMLDSSNFADTPSLVSVTVHPENQYFRSVDGVLFGRDDSSDSTDPSEKLFFIPRNRTGRFSVAAGTKTLGSFSFADCTGITEIAFPESLSVIEGSALLRLTA